MKIVWFGFGDRQHPFWYDVYAYTVWIVVATIRENYGCAVAWVVVQGEVTGAIVVVRTDDLTRKPLHISL